MSIQKVKLLFQVSAVWRGVSLCVFVWLTDQSADVTQRHSKHTLVAHVSCRSVLDRHQHWNSPRWHQQGWLLLFDVLQQFVSCWLSARSLPLFSELLRKKSAVVVSDVFITWGCVISVLPGVLLDNFSQNRDEQIQQSFRMWGSSSFLS